MKKLNELIGLIRCYQIATLPSFAESLKWLEIFTKKLKRHGIHINPMDFLDQDPWKFLETEKDRITRAKEAVQEIQAGKRSRPEFAAQRWIDSFNKKMNEAVLLQESMEEVRHKVEDIYGDRARWAADDANFEIDHPNLFEAS